MAIPDVLPFPRKRPARRSYIREARGVAFDLNAWLTRARRTLPHVTARTVRDRLQLDYKAWRAYSVDMPYAVYLRLIHEFGGHGFENLPARPRTPAARLNPSYRPYIDTRAPAEPAAPTLAIAPQLVRDAPHHPPPFDFASAIQAIEAEHRRQVEELAKQVVVLQQRVEHLEAIKDSLERDLDALTDPGMPDSSGPEPAATLPAAKEILKRVGTRTTSSLELLQKRLPKMGDEWLIQATERAAKTFVRLPKADAELCIEHANRFMQLPVADRGRVLTIRRDLEKDFSKGVGLLRAGTNYMIVAPVRGGWLLYDFIDRNDSRFFRNER